MRFAWPRLRFRFIVAEEYQPLRVVPVWLWMLIAFSASFQASFKYRNPPEVASAGSLPEPPTAAVLDAAAFGDHPALAKGLTLWLQAFDNQQGISIPFRELDYSQVAAWLGAILDLDPRAEYPMFNASRIYTFVRNEPDRVRVMLDFIREKFREDPATRWEWMSHAVTLAKHDLKDEALAREFARELRLLSEGHPEVPGWATQMEIFLLEDSNEYDDASRLLLNLVESGEITDPREFLLLYERLEQLLTKMIEAGEVTSRQQFDRMEQALDKLRSSYLKSHEETAELQQ